VSEKKFVDQKIYKSGMIILDGNTLKTIVR